MVEFLVPPRAGMASGVEFAAELEMAIKAGQKAGAVVVEELVEGLLFHLERRG